MPIQVTFNVRNMELNDHLRDYIEKRVEKLDRYLDVLEEAKVELTHAESARSAEDRQVAQLTIRGKGVQMRAEQRTADIYNSVDSVISKINRQIERFKGKRWRARGDGRTMAEVLAEEQAQEEAEEQDLIVRRKRFQLMPMDELEAIEQMSLLGHEDFFVFMNEQTNEVNVLYRRRDGTFGLIETEIA